MKVVLQRVSEASVTVDDEVTGSIAGGLLLLVGIHEDDSEEQVDWMVDKILKLRVFEDEEGKMNRSVTDVGGGLLLVSQFTLFGDARKGTRPSYIEAAGPEKAEKLYDYMVTRTREKSDLAVETGVFAAKMDVASVNDGPVTLILEK